MKQVLIRGMHGLGDNLYQRAALRDFMRDDGFYLSTSWPQLYADMAHIHPVRPSGIDLRTQSKNLKTATGFVDMPERPIRMRLAYPSDDRTILDGLLCCLDHSPRRVRMNGTHVERHPMLPDKPYVLVRPVTTRSEWRADARAPDPEYIYSAAEAAAKAGYTVVSVADLEPGKEWAEEPLPEADIYWHSGELDVMGLMSCVKYASGVIGGVGWIVPASLAYKTPLLLIYGGWGHDNGPHRLLDPRVDSAHIVQATPDDFCMCADWMHDCDKRISGMEGYIDEFITRISGPKD